MMAVVIFSIVILSLVGLSFRIAKNSTRATDQALGMAVLLAEVDEMTAANFDSLPGLAGCDTTASGGVKVIGCTSVTNISPRLDSIQIVVRTTLPNTRPDTITMQRAKWRFVPLR
jgi:Tfp pilus assembly protein PilV